MISIAGKDSEHSEREGEASQALPVEGATQAPIMGIYQRARRALRGRLHPALPVEGATQAPINKGFTLLELLIVLLLLSLGSSIVLPSIERGLKRMEARRSALELGAVARDLRSKAIYEGRPKGLVINPLENSYQTMDQRKVILPADVKIIRVEGGELAGDGRRIFIFFPNGSILGGEIGISGSEGTPLYFIRFSPLSGRIGVVRGI